MDNNAKYVFKIQTRKIMVAHIYVLPLLALVLFVLVYPILSSIFLSFQETKIPIGAIPFEIISLKNYIKMFSDPQFYTSVLNTFIIAFFASFASIVVGLTTALAVNKSTLFKRLAILPWAIPSVTAAIIWGWLFDGSFGLLNWVLVNIGILKESIIWNQSPWGSMFMVILVLVWKGYPFITIMTLAGLQSIPNDMYEAAEIDGANAWHRFYSITLPLLKPVIAISGFLTVLWIFRDYPIVYLLTGGGPIGKTRTLALMTYQQAFESFNMSYGATIGVFTLVICFIMAYFIIGLQKKTNE